MKNVTLKFPSTHILWLFRRTASLMSLQVNPSLRTLTCACNAEDINAAISSFGAEIVEPKSCLNQNILDNDHNDDPRRLGPIASSNNNLLLFAEGNSEG